MMATQTAQLIGGPEGFVYVPPTSPLFTKRQHVGFRVQRGQRGGL